MNVNMKHLDCTKVTQLGELFSGIRSCDTRQNILVYYFNTSNAVDISGIVSNSETGYIEFLADTVVKLDNASNIFKSSIYAGDVNVQKLFGIFDISSAKRIDSMFCDAQIEGDIGMYDITFSRLLSSKNMFNCADAGCVSLDNVKFPSTHIDYMFYGLNTDTLVLNNVDFSETRADDISEVFSESRIEYLVIYPNCKWPDLPRYNRSEVIELLFSQCEIFSLCVSKQDTELIDAIKKNNPYVEIEYI